MSTSSKERLEKRFKECWIRLSDALEDENCIDSTMVLARGKHEKRKFQVHITITTDEYDFLDTGHGEVKL